MRVGSVCHWEPPVTYQLNSSSPGAGELEVKGDARAQVAVEQVDNEDAVLAGTSIREAIKNVSLDLHHDLGTS